MLNGAREILVALVATVGASMLNAQNAPSNEALQATFTRWQAEHRMVGIAVGRLDGTGRSFVTSGLARTGGSELITDSTIFEIGSITKTFTATLLADMVLKGEVALDDSVAKYLPGWSIPTFGGKAITLLDLATHTSGLPRMPDNFHPADNDDPYADYSEAQMQAFLGGHTLRRAPGAQYEYSNFGMALLGVALAKRAGKPYETLLRERILDPLALANTRVSLDAMEETRTATGHNATLAPVKAWHFAAFAPAGALHATVIDMLRYAAAVSDTTEGPLAKAIAFAIRPRRSYNGADSIGLAWHHLHAQGNDIVWHNGETGGFHSWLGVDIAHRRAVVVLANANSSIDEVGQALLRGSVPGDPPSVDFPAEIALPVAELAKFVGRYALTPQFVVEITQQGDSLFEQATGQPKLRIYPASATEFFLRAVKAELLFQLDASGAVDGLVLRQNGVDQPARRVQ